MLADLFGIASTLGPDKIHDHMFQFTEGLATFVSNVKHCSVTLCNT